MSDDGWVLVDSKTFAVGGEIPQPAPAISTGAAAIVLGGLAALLLFKGRKKK